MSIWSQRSRRRDASTLVRMALRDSPFAAGPLPTLVATIMSARLPLRAIQSPIIVSDSPPAPPGVQSTYWSAVSMNVPPRSAYASSTAAASSGPTVHPNTLPPRHSGYRRDCRAEDVSADMKRSLGGRDVRTGRSLVHMGVDTHHVRHSARTRNRRVLNASVDTLGKAPLDSDVVTPGRGCAGTR